MAGGEGDVGLAGSVGSIVDVGFQPQLLHGSLHCLFACLFDDGHGNVGINGGVDVTLFQRSLQPQVEDVGTGIEPCLAVVDGGAETVDVDVVNINIERGEVEGGWFLLLVALGENVEVGGSRGGGVEVGVAVGDIQPADDDGAVAKKSFGINGQRQMAERRHGVSGGSLRGVDEDDVAHVKPQLGKGFEEGEVDAPDPGVAGDVFVGHLADNGSEPCRGEDEPAGNEYHQKDEAEKRGKSDAGYLERFLHISLPYRIYTSWW